MAAVYPAGPDPMMIRSRTPSCSAGGMTGSAISPVVTAGPGVGWELVTGGTTRIVGAAFPRSPAPRRAAVDRRPSAGRARRVDGDLGDVGGERVVAGHQAGDPDEHEAGRDRLVEGEVGGVGQRAGGGLLEAVEGVRRLLRGADLDRGAG